jgi:cytochrome c peroxidase
VLKAFHPGFGEREWRGYQLFVQASCPICHMGPLLSDQQFHNIGLAQRGRHLDLGRAVGIFRAQTNPLNCPADERKNAELSESCREWPYLRFDNPEMVGAFKTPSLRNIEVTAPYMHDGRFARLEDVLEHYDRLSDTPALGHRAEALNPLGLSSAEKADLIAFLKSLTSPIRDATDEGSP